MISFKSKNKYKSNMIKKFFNLILYILRYFSIISNYNYSVSKKISFGSKKADHYFIKMLKKTKFYLEYGSGSSTILAKNSKKKFLSIETDKSFFKYMRKLKIIEVIYSDIGPTKYYSFPLLPTLFLKSQIKKYANQTNTFYEKFNNLPDLILVDGRFRVFVTLMIVDFFLKKNTKKDLTIIIDDYKFRKNYHILKKIVKVKSIGRLGIIYLNNKTKINLVKLNKLSKKFIYDFN